MKSSIKSICPVCAGKRGQVIYDMRVVSSPGNVPGWIVQCPDCSMWFKVVDGLNSVSEAYDETYAANNMAAEYMGGSEARTFSRKVLEGIDRRNLDPHPTLLDVGCGLGAMMEEAKDLGYLPVGIDICTGLVTEARGKGLNVFEGSIADFNTGERFDVVTLMDLIEHVQDPLAVLAGAKALLKPGGELVIYTPNHDSTIVRLGNVLAKWRTPELAQEIFGSNHVSFFSQHTLKRALEESGFELRRIQMLPYNPRRPGGNYPGVKLWALYVFELLARPFGQLFRIVAFATPKARVPVR